MGCSQLNDRILLVFSISSKIPTWSMMISIYFCIWHWKNSATASNTSPYENWKLSPAFLEARLKSSCPANLYRLYFNACKSRIIFCFSKANRRLTIYLDETIPIWMKGCPNCCLVIFVYAGTCEQFPYLRKNKLHKTILCLNEVAVAVRPPPALSS